MNREKSPLTELKGNRRTANTQYDIRSPWKTDPNSNPIVKRASALIKQDLTKSQSGLGNTQYLKSKKIKFAFSKNNDVMSELATKAPRKFDREPLDVYLEYINNKEIETITSDHIHIFELFKLAKHFQDNEIQEQILDYVNENINVDTIPIFILKIVNLSRNFDTTHDEIFKDLDSEWNGTLTKIIDFIDSKNIKQIAEALKNEFELFLLENENVSTKKIDFLMYFIGRIPYVSEKTKVMIVSVFFRHFAKLNGHFTNIAEKNLGKDFLNKNKDLVKDIYGDKNASEDNHTGDSIIYRNLMYKAELKYKQKLAEIEDFMKKQFLEMSKRIDEYKTFNDELVQKNLLSEKEITSLKFNVSNLAKMQQAGLKEENAKSNTEVVNEVKMEFESMKNELKLNTYKIEILEKEKENLIENNELLTKKLKKSKKISEGLKSVVENLENTISKNNEFTRKSFNSNEAHIEQFRILLTNADENFGNLTKDLDTIKDYLHKEYVDHENTKKSNNILRLLNSQMEEKIKNQTGAPITLNNQASTLTKTSSSKGYSQSNINAKINGRPSAQPKIKGKENKGLSFAVKKTFTPSSQQINCITNVSYGTTEIIAEGGTDNVIKLYNLEYWDIIATLTGHRDFISCILFLNDFQPLLISGSADRTIKIWKLSNNSCIHNIIAHGGTVFCLLYLGKSLIVSGSGDKSMKIWNIDNGACYKKIQLHNNYVTSLISLSSFKKNLIVSGSWDSVIKIWDFEGEDVSAISLKGHEDYVNCLLYLDNWDKELLVSGGQDRNVILWNFVKGDIVKTAKGHESPVTCLMSLNSLELSTIISGSDDKTLRVWYLTSGDCISVVKTEHNHGIKAMLKVDFKGKETSDKGDKECFITAGNDKVVKLWQLK